MNLRLVLFSACVTALVGAGIGFGISRIERNPSQIRYQNRYVYQSMYQRYFTGAGAGAGFVIGAGLQIVKQLKDQRDREMGIE
jgi:hypothetical protein